MEEIQITADKLSQSVERIITKYTKSVDQNVDKAAKKIATEGRKALKAASQQFDTRWTHHKIYSSGWRTRKVQDLWFRSYIIYNSKHPYLTHLLERGHELNRGGRARAFPHIGPIAEKIPEDLSKATIDAIRRSK